MSYRNLKPGEPPPRENMKIRILRALSGLSEEEFAKRMQVDTDALIDYEEFRRIAEPEDAERAALAAGVPPEFGDEALSFVEDCRRRRRAQLSEIN